MTTIGMQYEVKPGKEEEFEKGFLTAVRGILCIGLLAQRRCGRAILRYNDR